MPADGAGRNEDQTNGHPEHRDLEHHHHQLLIPLGRRREGRLYQPRLRQRLRRLQPHDHLQRTGVRRHKGLFGARQAGNDTITTAAGDDVVYGGSGADTISTGKGQDELFGGSGADKLYAGSGDDALDGGSGNDVMDGGSGTDYLFGGTGNDTMTGGSDRDFFTVTLTSGLISSPTSPAAQDKIVLGWDIRQYLPDTYQGLRRRRGAREPQRPGLEPAANTTAPR